MLGWTQGVCLPVCLSVCVSRLYSLNGLANFDETSHKESRGHGPVSFFSDFGYLNLMTSWRPFCFFLGRHSHGRNFGPIYFKLIHDVAYRYPVFAIENQQNRLVTSGFIKNRAYDFFEFFTQNSRQNQNCPI